MFKKSKRSGRQRALDAGQERITVGYIVWRNLQNDAPTCKEVQSWIWDLLEIEVSIATVERLLQRNGLSVRRIRLENGGRIVSADDIQLQAYEFILKARKKMHFEKDVHSIDATYTSHQRVGRSGIGVRGGPQPRGTLKLPRFTNCIVTCVTRHPHGMYVVQRPILFSSNPVFDLTANGKSKRAYLRGKNILDFQVAYSPDEPSFCRENPSIMAHALKCWVLPNAL